MLKTWVYSLCSESGATDEACEPYSDSGLAISGFWSAAFCCRNFQLSYQAALRSRAKAANISTRIKAPFSVPSPLTKQEALQTAKAKIQPRRPKEVIGAPNFFVPQRQC